MIRRQWRLKPESVDGGVQFADLFDFFCGRSWPARTAAPVALQKNQSSARELRFLRGMESTVCTAAMAIDAH